MDLKKYIINKSKELYIDEVGFTDCGSLERVKDYLIGRKEKGKQTEFEEENVEKRIRPELLLESCKTIIVIGVSYNIDVSRKARVKLKGSLSKSSWGIDYHIVLKEKMERLIKEIRKVEEFNYKYFVDTGPLIDREIANKAEIGYYGKNCSIINDEYGSFMFLGYILTDLDVRFKSGGIENKCGDCNLCLDACPTGALEEPFKLNPKKCISYLTQTKEKIPYELREKMGMKIYGCDTCQLVCPKNKNSKKSSNKKFIPKKTKGYIDIEELLKMSNREFREKYGGMAGSWRGKNILKRNGVIALGNTKKKEYIEVLKPIIESDPSSMVRKYAAWAILNIDKKVGQKIIEDALVIEKDENVKKEFVNLMQYID